MPVGLFIVVVLAAYRITRLVNEDTILDRPRTWFYMHAPKFLAEMVGCPFCVGFWIAGIVVAVTNLAVPVNLPVLYWFGAAGGSALIYELISKGSDD